MCSKTPFGAFNSEVCSQYWTIRHPCLKAPANVMSSNTKLVNMCMNSKDTNGVGTSSSQLSSGQNCQTCLRLFVHHCHRHGRSSTHSEPTTCDSPSQPTVTLSAEHLFWVSKIWVTNNQCESENSDRQSESTYSVHSKCCFARPCYSSWIVEAGQLWQCQGSLTQSESTNSVQSSRIALQGPAIQAGL